MERFLSFDWMGTKKSTFKTGAYGITVLYLSVQNNYEIIQSHISP